MTALDRLLAECEPGLWQTEAERSRAVKLARIVRVLREHARYFADSPPEEHGGYNAETIAEAKRALAEAERIAGEDA